MQIHTIPPIHNNPCGGYSGQQSQRLTSTSEEDEETQNNSKNEWQVISIKRKKYTEYNPTPLKQT
jgi:hypothetical protein